jgi:hypothetical protein
MEDVEVPPLPPPKDPLAPVFPRPRQKTREEQLRDTREDLRKARRELAELVPVRDFCRRLAGADPDGVVPFAVAEGLLETAGARAATAENLRSDPPAFDSRAFLRRLGLSQTNPEGVAWTPALIGRGLAVYAGYAQEPPERFRDTVLADVEEWAEELTRRVRQLEGEVVAVTRLLEGRTARKQAAKLLPGDGRDERIAKYERHLHNLLTSTLHELERLQARREGEAVPPPAVADVNVTVDTGAA